MSPQDLETDESRPSSTPPRNPAAPRTHPDTCPLVPLLAEAVALIARRHAADEAERDALELWKVKAASRTVAEVSQTLEHVAARASDYRPNSPEGALFALVLAAAEAETLAGCDDTERDRVARRLRRHFYGLRAWLERDATLPAGICAYWMRTETDPHAALAG